MIKLFGTTKGAIGGNPNYGWSEEHSAVNYLHEGNACAILVIGTAARPGDTDTMDVYVGDMTRPYIIYRESRSRTGFFWMKLDLENPNEPQGGELTAQGAINAMKEEIWNSDRRQYPVADPNVLLREEGGQ